MNYSDAFKIDATLVANEFLDNYMPRANGDYVKVYLYILKNGVNGIDVGTIADNLLLTEGDVRRALKYWEKEGILTIGNPSPASTDSVSGMPSALGDRTGTQNSVGQETGKAAQLTQPDSRNGRVQEPGTQTAGGYDADQKQSVLSESAENAAAEASQNEQLSGTAQAAQSADEAEDIRGRYKTAAGKEALNRLSADAEFEQLLRIVQKYLSKILNDSEQQVFAYLYDGLHLPCDVLDYLVDYCVQHGHSSIRYIEKVGLDWATLNIRDVETAKSRTREFDSTAERSAKKKTVKKDQKGVSRNTDYDSLILEQVIRKMK